MLLGALFEPRLQWRLPLALLIGTVGVNAWLWWMEPALRYYCGLSGILNSLLIVGLLQLWRDCRDPLVLLTGVAAAAKILGSLISAWTIRIGASGSAVMYRAAMAQPCHSSGGRTTTARRGRSSARLTLSPEPLR